MTLRRYLTPWMFAGALAACTTPAQEMGIHKAAVANDVEAQYHLALAYNDGEGVPESYKGKVESSLMGSPLDQDYAKAAEWFGRAAANGHADSQYRYGTMLATGRGVAANPTQAAYWMRQAADQGHVDAIESYGFMALEGKGTEKNIAEAVGYLAIAAEKKNDARIQRLLGDLYREGQGIEANPYAAARYTALAAAQGDSEAQFSTASQYLEGTYLDQNYVEAARWFRAAGEKGHAESQFQLANLYRDGLGVIQDHRQAAQWYDMSANQGHIQAQYELALLYRDGRGLTRNPVKSYAWLNIAATATSALPDNTAGRALRDKIATLRDELATGLSTDDLEESQEIAREWWKEHPDLKGPNHPK